MGYACGVLRGCGGMAEYPQGKETGKGIKEQHGGL